MTQGKSTQHLQTMIFWHLMQTWKGTGLPILLTTTEDMVLISVGDLVKVPIVTHQHNGEDVRERMRVIVEEVIGDYFYGVLDNNSAFSKKHKAGSRIYAPISSIVDFLPPHK